MYKRFEQDRGMSEPCRLNEASHHLLDSCILSGNVVKLPLMCQTDIQKTIFLCRGLRFIEDYCISCTQTNTSYSDLCTNERVTNSYLP